MANNDFNKSATEVLSNLYPIAQFCLDQLATQPGGDNPKDLNMACVKDTARRLLSEVCSVRASFTTPMCQRHSLVPSWELTQELNTRLEAYLLTSATYRRSGSDTPLLQRTLEGKNSGAAKEIQKELEGTFVQLTHLVAEEQERNSDG